MYLTFHTISYYKSASLVWERDNFILRFILRQRIKLFSPPVKAWQKEKGEIFNNSKWNSALHHFPSGVTVITIKRKPTPLPTYTYLRKSLKIICRKQQHKYYVGTYRNYRIAGMYFCISVADHPIPIAGGLRFKSRRVG